MGIDCGSNKIAWFGSALYGNENPSFNSATTVIKRALGVFKTWFSIVETLIRSTEKTSIVESGVYNRDSLTSWGVSDGKFLEMKLIQ